jgi:hypothetical protein
MVLDAVVEAIHGIAARDKAQREFVHPALLMEGRPSRIDPDRRRLLIMEFQNCVVGSAV